MRVVHVVPSAFEYFEDIRVAAFNIVEELDRQGIDSEIITLQYGNPSRSTREVAERQEMKRSYKGTLPIPELLESLKQCDIIHFHTPILGFLGKFITWQKTHLDAKVVVSYYRPIAYTDVLSWFIAWYNRHYLPRLAAKAKAIVYFTDYGTKSIAARMADEALVIDAHSFISEPLYEKTKTVSLYKISELGEAIIALYSQMLYT
jgi:hypothetical protein